MSDLTEARALAERYRRSTYWERGVTVTTDWILPWETPRDAFAAIYDREPDEDEAALLPESKTSEKEGRMDKTRAELETAAREKEIQRTIAGTAAILNDIAKSQGGTPLNVTIEGLTIAATLGEGAVTLDGKPFEVTDRFDWPLIAGSD